VVLAEVDAVKSPRFFPPLELGEPYLIFVTRPKGVTLANDFYFLRHTPGWGNPLEVEKGTGANDTPPTAEMISIEMGDGFIEGDLVMGAEDVDCFRAILPEKMTSVRAVCGARRYGSGLRGLYVSLLAADGSPLAESADDTETETHLAIVPNVPLGATQVVLKVSADSQDPMVAAAFYACHLHFTP
jgi:hypothetical protein